jgi:hypothetical protein
VCLSSAAYDQVRDRVKETFVDLGDKELKKRPCHANVSAHPVDG